jgi:hypothetical protein
MKLKFKETAQQSALIQAMGSKNMAVAREAQEAFARLIGPVTQIVLKKAGTASKIYTDAPYNEDTDNPSYPLDLYYNEGVGLVQVWSQNVAGGMPTSELSGLSELKFSTYRLDSAVSIAKRYARKARLDVVAKMVERMLQEVLVKRERNAWAVILKALAEANSPIVAAQAFGAFTNTYNKHILPTATENVFTLGDLNNLLNLIDRVNSAFDGGTPESQYSNGITELYISPEIMAQIRAMAYNPIFSTSLSSAVSTVTQLPESAREQIYANAGTNSFYGVNLVSLKELGDGKKYNTLFNSFTTSQNVPGQNSGVWQSTDQILVGIDNSRGAFIRPIARDGETGSTFNVEVDDQFNLKRIDKMGLFGSVQEGSVCLDAKSVVGIAC